jgi:hypothetical protein
MKMSLDTGRGPPDSRAYVNNRWGLGIDWIEVRGCLVILTHWYGTHFLHHEAMSVFIPLQRKHAESSLQEAPITYPRMDRTMCMDLKRSWGSFLETKGLNHLLMCHITGWPPPPHRTRPGVGRIYWPTACWDRSTGVQQSCRGWRPLQMVLQRMLHHIQDET